MMDGFLVIDKTSGMTSYNAIKRLKAIYPFKKIGYIGTLDRNATGILPVALNEGVKLIPFLENGEKTYIARFVLGITTDTFDLEGTRTSEVDPPRYDVKIVQETLSSFKGKIQQKVPLYSSKKMEGKPL
jgi:tRNA pseudouridine55 synthase